MFTTFGVKSNSVSAGGVTSDALATAVKATTIAAIREFAFIRGLFYFETVSPGKE
jgi:hypothetical protein